MTTMSTTPIAALMVAWVTIMNPSVIMADDTAARVHTPSTAQLPRGIIVMWSGSLDEIPDGWSLCNGENGTPDLRDRFVMGVGAEEYLGSRGGSISHSHTLDGHRHRIDPPRIQTRSVRGAYAYAGPAQYRSTTRIPTHDLDIQAFESDPGTARAQATSNLPPYFKIAFIMKN